ncbi:unnamed protein product [Alternaria alternata]
MTDSEVIFVYESVNRFLQEIRLICIIPEADGPIKCKLKRVNLQSNRTPDYRALSYTWGAPDPVQKIAVNNQSFFVRQNLYDFLKAFRARLYRFQDCGNYENEVQWLWIDQICIDQSVVEERNHQVEMMSDIYRKASYVYVWLGKSDKWIELAMKTIKADFRHYYDANPATKRSGKRRKPSRDKVADQDNELISASGDESSRNELFEPALQRFFENSYWLRLWIVQEVMLARYIRVICGETLLSWEELRRFCSSGLKRLSSEAALAVPPQVIWLARHALSDKQFTYSSLLYAFGTSGCENPRDKVYALQGVVKRENRPLVRYESSVHDVFENAALAMFRTAKRDSLVRNGTDLGSINYMGPIKNVFLDAAALWRKEIEGVIHLEMIEAWIILRKEMGMDPIPEPPAERSRLLEAVRPVWSHLAHFHLRKFLAKNQLQSTYAEDLENNNLDNTILDSERLLDSERFEMLITQLRHHYEGLVDIFRATTDFVVPPKPFYRNGVVGLSYPGLMTQFGKHSYCKWDCSQPAMGHIIL